MAARLCLKWNNHVNMLNEFKNFLLSEDMVDVTLSCDGKTLKAHKIILSACSPFFRSLFLENPCKHPVIILNGVKYSDLKAIIEYVYFGEVKVTEDSLSSLIKIAQNLKVKGLGELNSKTNQSGDELNEIEDELENQLGDESENEIEDELENQHGAESDHQPVNEVIHSSVLQVDLSNCKLTQEQLENFKSAKSIYEIQTEQEVLGDNNFSLKTVPLHYQKSNSSLEIRKKQPLKQCVDANSVSVASFESSPPSIFKRILAVDKSNSMPENFLKKISNSEHTNGKNKSCKYKRVSLKLQHSDTYEKFSQKTQNLKEFKCKQCSYATPYRSELLQHTTIHKKEQTYHCNMCSYETFNKSYLRKHLKRKHKIFVKSLQV